jgi:hypothetical protein
LYKETISRENAEELLVAPLPSWKASDEERAESLTAAEMTALVRKQVRTRKGEKKTAPPLSYNRRKIRGSFRTVDKLLQQLKNFLFILTRCA